MFGTEPLTRLEFALAILFLIMAVLWFFLPFVIYGLKSRVDNLDKESKVAVSLLTRIDKHLAAIKKQGDVSAAHAIKKDIHNE